MSLETEYHPEKAAIARQLFDEMDALAKTRGGEWLIAQSNLHGLVVRGSADGLLPGQSPLFIRSICDIDLRVYSKHSGYHDASIMPMMRFIGRAAKNVGLRLNVVARRDAGSRLKHRALRHFFPRIDIHIEDRATGRFIMGMHISLINAPPPPLIQTGFVKAEHPILRLAEKIRALNNTSRVLGITSGEEDQKIRRALDLLDTYQSYHIALAAMGSHQRVIDGLDEIYNGSMVSHFNRRTTMSVINQNLQQGFLYADLRRFDEATDMARYLPRLVKRMQRSGIIRVHETLNPAVVLATGYDLSGRMPLPISRTVLRLVRPLVARKKSKGQAPPEN